MHVQIVALHASPVHAYAGRPADGLGVLGDRYFARPAHRLASVTVIAVESLEHVARELGLDTVPDPLLTRRTVVLRGVDVDGLHRGAELTLDSGDGPVRLRAHRPANPCGWMDVVLAPGAFRALRGRGGVRAEPLSDGVLRVGPAVLGFAG